MTKWISMILILISMIGGTGIGPTDSFSHSTHYDEIYCRRFVGKHRKSSPILSLSCNVASDLCDRVRCCGRVVHIVRGRVVYNSQHESRWQRPVTAARRVRRVAMSRRAVYDPPCVTTWWPLAGSDEISRRQAECCSEKHWTRVYRVPT